MGLLTIIYNNITFFSTSNLILKRYNSTLDTFSSSIPNYYVHSDGKPLIIPFNIYEFDLLESCVKKLQANLEIGSYTCFVKIRYKDSNFIMCGNQFGVTYYNIEDLKDLANTCINKIAETFEV